MLNLYTFVDGHPLAGCGVEWLYVGYGLLLPPWTPLTVRAWVLYDPEPLFNGWPWRKRGQTNVRNFRCQTLNIIKLFITVICYNDNNFVSLINLLLMFRMWRGKVPNVFYCQAFFCIQCQTSKTEDRRAKSLQRHLFTLAIDNICRYLVQNPKSFYRHLSSLVIYNICRFWDGKAFFYKSIWYLSSDMGIRWY